MWSSSDPFVLAIKGTDIQRRRLLRLMGMLGSGIDPQVGQLLTAQRTARQHALDSLFDHPLRMLASQDRALRQALDPARMTGVPIENAGLRLVAGQPDFL